MKRIAAIVGIVLSVAIVVGAFIVGGGDDASEAKSPSSASVNLAKKASENITNAGAEVQSRGPVITAKDDDDDDDDDEGKYETRRVFVSVSPSTVRIGKEFKIEVRGFKPNSTVTVTIAGPAWYTPKLYEIKVDKNGKGKSKDIKAPTVEGVYSVVATGPAKTGPSSLLASTTLEVVKKK